MPDITPRLGLSKPLGNENNTRAAYNENLDRIDANAAKKDDVDLLTPKLQNYKEQVDTTTKDAAAGVYTVVNYRRVTDNSLYMRATLSNKQGNFYLTDTWQYYDAAGTAVTDTVTWTLTYDTDGLVTSKIPSKG